MSRLWTILWLAVACDAGGASPLPDPLATCPSAREELVDPPAAPTYGGTIAPLVARRCGACHRPGGLAPFGLASYAEVVRELEPIRLAVSERRMPPWSPAPCCQPYRDDRSLTDGERAALLGWIAAGAPPGSPGDPPPPPDPGALPRVDLRLRMPDAFAPSPTAGLSELRCFVVGAEIRETTYVVGVALLPGVAAEVHGAALLAVPHDSATALVAREGEDGRPGWDCSGTFGHHGGGGPVASWSAGQGASLLPDGTGREIAAGSRLILEMHYDVRPPIVADRSTLEVELASQVAHPLIEIGIANPQWQLTGGMPIPAGDPDASVFFAYDPTVLSTGGAGFAIHAVSIAMGQRGSSAKLGIVHADGSSTCLLDLPTWSWHWQGSYVLARPVDLAPGDHLVVECHWDNRAEHQPLVRGEQPPPRELGWGVEGELCAGSVLAAPR